MPNDFVVPPVYYLDEEGPATSSTSYDTPPPPYETGGYEGGFGADDGAFGGALETVNNYSLLELVQLFIVYAFIIAGALSAVFIFIGGITFILSGGNDEKIKSAVNTIRYSIVGLIVTILSFTFIMIVGRIFGLNLLNYISYEEIKCSINRLVQFGEDPTDNSCQQSHLAPRR